MSIPIGLVILIFLAVFATGLAAGWLAARQRGQRWMDAGARSRGMSQADILLNALPQAALITDSDANIIASNRLAVSVLAQLDDAGVLPPAIGLAVRRVVLSQAAEVLELAAVENVVVRLQAAVSPLQSSEKQATALVLFAEPKTSTGRTHVYRRLMNVIAHELRTPLTAILGHVEILGSCRPDEEVLWKRSLGFVSGEVERLARLVEDLLSLSRLDHIPVHIQIMNLRLAAEEALSALYEKAQQNKVTLVLQAPAELPRVQADPDRIRQVFLNLVDNAIKYAPGSQVTVHLKPEGAQLQVEIIDTGPGITAQDLPHIFAPLYRSENMPAAAQGSGLGLTIVRLILDQHNAPVNVHSVSGQGAIFSFSLPLAAPAEIQADRLRQM